MEKDTIFEFWEKEESKFNLLKMMHFLCISQKALKIIQL